MSTGVGESSGQHYGQYCPISRALEVLGERWSLLIVRDLVCGTTRFNELSRGLPGLSRTLLAKRLRQLVKAGIVDHTGSDYILTEAGWKLEPVVFGLGEWGAQWAFDDPRPEEVDPELLVWWMHGLVDTSELPGQRHVLKVEFSDHPRAFWIVVERGAASVCTTDPGYPVDLTMCGSLPDLYRVWLGRVPVSTAVRRGLLVVDGPRAWTRRLSRILQLSPAAALVPSADRSVVSGPA
ncbi:MAG: helix-turn-helix domain-containing protein [Ornithinimicrobium sp.]